MAQRGMQASQGGPAPAVTPEITAEAAVWIARLHGPDRSPLMERECREWQARSAAHRLAFEQCTEVWEAVPRVRLADAYASAARQEPASGAAGVPRRRRRGRWVVIASLLVVLAVGAGMAAHLWRGVDVYVTKVGEQQLVVLDDGTRMTLNTDTDVHVKMARDVRSVTVEAGEALFEVAKDPRRPFIVRAADSEVVALGTAFSVRLAGSGTHVDDALAITLIEGKVTVRPASADLAGGVAPAAPVLMQAGERIRLAKANGGSAGPVTQQVDRPRIEQMVAWKRSEVIFDDVSLPDAVAEMNRYSRTPIVLIGDASLSRLHVSGLYRTGDSTGFAQAVAALHGLGMRERDGRLELAPPQ